MSFVNPTSDEELDAERRAVRQLGDRVQKPLVENSTRSGRLTDEKKLNVEGAVEVRAVWYLSNDEAISLPLNRLEEGISTSGRQPDVFGVYQDDRDGLQMLIDDRRTIEQAQELAIEVAEGNQPTMAP